MLIVTEPTVSGAHDFARALKLAQHFNVAAAVCINKWDLHPELAAQIEADARAAGATPVGRIRYNKIFTDAQRQGRAIIEMGPGEWTDDITAVWHQWLALAGLNSSMPS